MTTEPWWVDVLEERRSPRATREPVPARASSETPLSERMAALVGELEAVLEAAKAQGDVKTCALVLRELRQALDTLGTTTGKLPRRGGKPPPDPTVLEALQASGRAALAANHLPEEDSDA